MSDIFFDAASEADYGGTTPTFAQTIAEDLRQHLDVWYGVADNVYDDEMDAQIHAWYAEALSAPQTFPPRGTYFSPSSVNSCKRELYEKLMGAPRDKGVVPPHQGRWKRIGTAIGDIIQRDMLLAERHMERLTGQTPRFVFERTDEGRPLFEDFAKRLVTVEHDGTPVTFWGACDGIMRYTTANGKTLRVGIEVKSKQTTYSQTSPYSMRHGPKTDHVKQAISYGIMYGVDYYVILYVNASKKAWNMTSDDYAKNPDVAAFGVAITDRDRQIVLDDLVDVLKAVERGTPPKIDLTRWTFNNLREACAKSITDDEMAEMERDVDAFVASNVTDAKKRDMTNALRELTELRRQYVEGTVEAV